LLKITIPKNLESRKKNQHLIEAQSEIQTKLGDKAVLGFELDVKVEFSW
jgi:hypothetical protein